MSPGVHTNPSVPFTVPVKINSGSKIIITGTPAGTKRFTIYLLTGPSVDHDDVAFVFDVRFNMGNDKQKIIRNHKSGGKWGTEERKDDFPFTANNIHEIVIKVKGDSYKVVVNDEKYCTHFCHIKPEHVNHLSITGDIALSKVEIEE